MAVTVSGMSRRPHVPDRSTYSGAVAARLRELRESRGWSIDDWMNKLAEVAVVRACKKCEHELVASRSAGSSRCPRRGCGGKLTAEPLLIPRRSCYAYETGKYQGGADLPMDYYPIVAEMYGYSTPHGWLPQSFGE